MATKPYKGVTPPISLRPPTEWDLNENERLLDSLEALGALETEQGTREISRALRMLEGEAQLWIMEECAFQCLPDDLIEKAGGKIFPFGSFRLGGNACGSGLEALLVAPWFVSREAFFGSFYLKLLELPETTKIRCFPDAFVPTMKLKFRGVEIDLLFASLLSKTIPADFDLVRYLGTLHFNRMDPQTVRSLNSVRVTEAILGLVPDVEVFKISLKAIRTWAMSKQLYSNAPGFPGDVSWAILTARICQLFPKACAAMIVQKFFFVLDQWEWPRPVLLKRCANLDFLESWQVMPIITPAAPPQNSTYNITEATLKIMKEAFAEAVETIKAINFKKASWLQLFSPAKF